VAREQLAEVEQLARLYFEGRDVLEPISPAELRKRMKKGDVTVVDVRPESEYRSGHIPGALSIPAGELKRRLAEIPRGRPVVAYCRGAYCVLAIDALEQLQRRGFEGRRLAGGLPEWRLSGQRVAVGSG
jgi:rhodanese-related sulfurtransferase